METRSKASKRKHHQEDSGSVNSEKVAKSESSNEQAESDQNDAEDTKGINPLLMEDILSHLVKFLDLDALKHSRLVCKLWNEEIKTILFQNRVVSVPQKFYAEFGSNEEEKNVQLDKLRELFFSSVGKIKTIKFADYRDTKSFIRLGLPWEKIEIIISTINQFEMEQEDNGQAFEELLFMTHHLKYIKNSLNGSSSNSCMKLLELCLSVAELRGKEGKFLHPILLSKLNIDIRTIEDLNKLRQLSESSLLQLERVEIHPIFSIAGDHGPEMQLEVTELLEKILDKYKNILVQLLIDDKYGVFTHFKIPVLPKLVNFMLSCDPERAQQQFQFPPQFQFHTFMPKLDAVVLFLGNSRDFWNIVFLGIEPAPSVKRLMISSSLGFAPTKIFQTFSSIETLTIHSNSLVDFSTVGTYCANLKHVCYTLSNDELSSKLLVSRITGFPLGIIEAFVNSVEIKNVEDFRKLSSLWDLPELTKFSLLGSSEEEVESFQRYLPLAQDLVLQHISNLKVEQSTSWKEMGFDF